MSHNRIRLCKGAPLKFSGFPLQYAFLYPQKSHCDHFHSLSFDKRLLVTDKFILQFAFSIVNKKAIHAGDFVSF